MADAAQQLLDAAILHLERLKAQGVRFVPVSEAGMQVFGPGATAPKRPVAPPAFAPRPVAAPKPNPLPAVIPASPKLPEGVLASKILREPVPLQGLAPEARAAAFAELRTRALACVKCANLASSRKNVVFGVGNIEAELMFVGEAPGADEDEVGEPFVGKAGQLLTKIIQATGLSRDRVYIANILKCRPDSRARPPGNRKPTTDEMQTCILYLHEQIDLIRPRVLVALGATAVEGLLGKTAGITRLRGNWQVYRGIPLMPTYHPAYLLRNQAISEKRRVWEDMLQVMEKLAMPISEKQRGFFLKSA